MDYVGDSVLPSKSYTMGRRRATPASSSSPTPASSSPTHSSSPGTSPDAATLRPSPSPPPIAGANSKGSAKGPSPRRSPSLTVKPHRPKPRRQPWAGDWSSSWLPGKSPAVDKSFKASPRNHDSYRVKERKERQRQRPGHVAASPVALNSTASPPRYSREQEQQEPQQQHTRLDFSMRSTPRPPSQSRRSRTAEQQQRTTPPRAMSPRSFTVMQGRNVPLLNESAALTADERGWDGRAPVWDNYIPSGGHGSLDGGRLGQTEAFIKRPSSVAGWATRDKQPRVSPLLFTNSMGHCRTHHEPDMPWEVPIDSAYQHPIHNPNRPLTSPMLLTGKLRILDVSQRPPVAMFETYKTEGDSLASTPMPMVLQVGGREEEGGRKKRKEEKKKMRKSEERGRRRQGRSVCSAL